MSDTEQTGILELPCYVAGEEVDGELLDVIYPYSGELAGGKRNGAAIEPIIIADVPRDAQMVVEESFGPLAPIMPVEDLDDAIDLANGTAFGLSSGIVTRDMQAALTAVKRIRSGTVNVNTIPGYRIESSPFGGVKDSGLGIKEGVIEAIKYMTSIKTFSLPW